MEVVKDYIRFTKNWHMTFLDRLGFIKGKYLIEMRNGLKFKVQGGSSQRTPLTEVFNEQYFSGEVVVNEGDTVVDIGGNAGFFSISIAGKARKVYTIEPISMNYATLVENIRLNGYQNKIFPFQKAIMAHDRSIIVDVIGENTPIISLVIHREGKNMRREEVKTVTLQRFMQDNNITHIDFLKMDIEGAEYEVILNADQKVFQVIDKIAMEVHAVEGHSEGEITNRLRRIGYTVKTGKDNMLYAFRKP
jgi:FkbM family methyltransferase